MFRNMEYIYTVWQEKSFSSAAKKLFISQPALSNSVKRIEKKVGGAIFDRSISPICLTDIGKEYIKTIEQMTEITNNFYQYLDDNKNLKKGNITIGSNSILSSYVLPTIISKYTSKFPSISVNIIEGSTMTLKEYLSNGTIDLVISSNFTNDEEFCELPLCDEHILLAVPKDWEINQTLIAWQHPIDNIIDKSYLSNYFPDVPLEKFKDYPFILLEHGDIMRKSALDICHFYNFVPKEALLLAQQITAYNMVCENMGATFVSDILIKNTIQHPNIVYYKLNSEVATRSICMYYKKNRYVPHCMSNFLSDAKIVFDDNI